MEYNNHQEDYFQTSEDWKRKKEIEAAYRYDNSIRSEWIMDVQSAFVTDQHTLAIWQGVTDIALDLLHSYCTKHGLPAEYDRLRMFAVNDPGMLQEYGAQPMELFYRTAELPNQDKNVPFTPWPDVCIGEFFILYEDGRETRAVTKLNDKLGTGVNTRRERVTNHDEFPKTLLEAKTISRDHLWFPGTNVPIEDMTEQLWSDLAQTLPDEMAF